MEGRKRDAKIAARKFPDSNRGMNASSCTDEAWSTCLSQHAGVIVDQLRRSGVGGAGHGSACDRRVDIGRAAAVAAAAYEWAIDDDAGGERAELVFEIASEDDLEIDLPAERIDASWRSPHVPTIRVRLSDRGLVEAATAEGSPTRLLMYDLCRLAAACLNASGDCGDGPDRGGVGDSGGGGGGGGDSGGGGGGGSFRQLRLRCPAVLLRCQDRRRQNRLATATEHLLATFACLAYHGRVPEDEDDGGSRGSDCGVGLLVSGATDAYDQLSLRVNCGNKSAAARPAACVHYRPDNPSGSERDLNRGLEQCRRSGVLLALTSETQHAWAESAGPRRLPAHDVACVSVDCGGAAEIRRLGVTRFDLDCPGRYGRDECSLGTARAPIPLPIMPDDTFVAALVRLALPEAAPTAQMRLRCLLVPCQNTLWLCGRLNATPEEAERQISRRLHHLMSAAGFNADRVGRLCRLADCVEELARDAMQDERHLVGSLAEGWGADLTRASGRPGPGTDENWLVMAKHEETGWGAPLHPEGLCACRDAPRGSRGSGDGTRGLRLVGDDGHAVGGPSVGPQPQSTPASLSRPAQREWPAYRCCCTCGGNGIGSGSSGSSGSSGGSGAGGGRRPSTRRTASSVSSKPPTSRHQPPAQPPHPQLPPPLLLVRWADGGLRADCSLAERAAMRRLTTPQGRLFILLKLACRHLLPAMGPRHAKSLLFHLIAANRSSAVWQDEFLVDRVKDALVLLEQLLAIDKRPSVSLPNFFAPAAAATADGRWWLPFEGPEADSLLVKTRAAAAVADLRTDLGRLWRLAEYFMRRCEPLLLLFQPFALMPTPPERPVQLRLRSNFPPSWYSFVHRCLEQLADRGGDERQQQQWQHLDRADLLRQLDQLAIACRLPAVCLTVMAHLRFGDRRAATAALAAAGNPDLRRGLDPAGAYAAAADSAGLAGALRSRPAVASRFCFRFERKPRYPYLPEAAVRHFPVRLAGRRDLYSCNFLCLWWALCLHLLTESQRRSPQAEWLRRLADDPDPDELHLTGCATADTRLLRRCIGLLRRIEAE